MNCENCKFWSRLQGSKTDGKCRCHAPQLGFSGFGFLTIHEVSTDTDAMWPISSHDDFCGEFAAKGDQD